MVLLGLEGPEDLAAVCGLIFGVFDDLIAADVKPELLVVRPPRGNGARPIGGAVVEKADTLAAERLDVEHRNANSRGVIGPWEEIERIARALEFCRESELAEIGLHLGDLLLNIDR